MRRRTFVGNGDEIEEIDLVEFRLLFEGELLPSAGSKKRTSEKHVIRQSFHPQLRRLWSINANLRKLAGRSYRATFPGPDGNNPDPTPQERFDGGIAKIGKNWSRAGFEFVPLVTPDMALRCSIDITLLRPEEDRLIFEAGDIDGQLKTLFDALRIPKDASELGGATPQADETPFFCLLEDDRLVSEVRVSTDQMLLLPNRREVKANDAHAVIHVKLNHKNARTFDNYFG
jgi:hypothetical protein